LKIDLSIACIRSFFSSFQREKVNNPRLIQAGVLVPLFDRNGELHILLTQRADEVEHHKGQISFPGGTVEKADKSIIDTALREAEEEIGLQRKTVEVLGVFSDYSTPSGFCITPVVAFLSSFPSLSINEAEVSEVFDVPLSFFLNSTNERIDRRERAGKVTNIYFYLFGKYEIWGATAAIIRLFLHALIDWNKHKKVL
jgi:8-oxo-dGTP pyrophosphatase MutT (NUDIX family)